jgi:hypothetical protein
MDIINDTSSQTVITTLPTITGTYNPLISQTDLNTALALKQNTLTAATNLLGIGSSITAINWNNITLNRPTNFQADWTSTVINRPTTFNPDLTNIYTKTQVDNITTLTNFYNKTSIDTSLSAKQNNLIASTLLAGIGSNITLLNYNNLYNPPNLSVYATTSQLSSYALTTSLSSYITVTALNSCNYITNATTGLINYSTTTAMNSAISTALVPYLTTSMANTTYLRLDGSASMSSKLLLLTDGQGNPSFATDNGGAGDRIVFASGVAGSIVPYYGYSLNNLWISAQNTATINNFIG